MFKMNKEFLKFESQENLFEISIEGVKIWKCIRNYIHEQLLNQRMGVDERVSTYKNKLSKKFFFLKQYRHLLKNPFHCLEKKDLLVINHPRRIRENNQYICIYTNELLKNFKKKYYVFENPYWLEDESYLTDHFVTNETKDLIYSDYIEMKSRLLYKFKVLKSKIIGKKLLRKRDELLLRNLCKNIESALDISLNNNEFIEKITEAILFEKVARPIYYKAMKMIMPKVIIEIYTPSKHIAVLNEVAHEMGIDVIDIQHGVIGSYEPIMYSFDVKKKYKHLSDYIFTFGEYWTKKNNFHLNSDRIIPVGFPFIEKKKKSIMNNRDIKKRTILFISQSYIGEKLGQLASKLSEILEDNNLQIVFKLHPYENGKYLNGEYKWLEDKNIKIINGIDTHVYNLYEEAICVVGVYSTVLFEALAFGLPIFIYSEYGASEINHLCDNETVYQVNRVEDIVNNIEKIQELNKTGIKNNFSCYFLNNSIHNIISKVECIIGENGELNYESYI